MDRRACSACLYERPHHVRLPPRRLGGHLRRHGIAYAALTVALSFSPVPSMAADLVTTGDIANGAVTRPKLAADSVVSTKIVNDSIFRGRHQERGHR